MSGCTNTRIYVCTYTYICISVSIYIYIVMRVASKNRMLCKAGDEEWLDERAFLSV